MCVSGDAINPSLSQCPVTTIVSSMMNTTIVHVHACGKSACRCERFLRHFVCLRGCNCSDTCAPLLQLYSIQQSTVSTILRHPRSPAENASSRSERFLLSCAIPPPAPTCSLVLPNHIEDHGERLPSLLPRRRNSPLGAVVVSCSFHCGG